MGRIQGQDAELTVMLLRDDDDTERKARGKIFRTPPDVTAQSQITVTCRVVFASAFRCSFPSTTMYYGLTS
jgi:hypothetical protein